MSLLFQLLKGRNACDSTCILNIYGEIRCIFMNSDCKQNTETYGALICLLFSC